MLKQKGEGEPEKLEAPKVVVREGQRAIVRDEWQSPIVTAVKAENGAKNPVIQVLDQGITLNITAYGNHDGRITVDAAAELSHIGPVEAKNGRQTTEVKSQRTRKIDCVAPGEKLVVALDPPENSAARHWVEIVVTEANAEQETARDKP
jgi:hypothetical protein